MERTENASLRDTNLIEDDQVREVVATTTNDEEIKALQDLALEQINKEESEEENSSKSSAEPPKDNSEEQKKAEEEAAKLKEQAEADEKAKNFVLTEELINQQPEEVRALLNNFKGQNKEALEKAIANAYILRSGEKDIVKALIASQKEVGKKEPDPIIKKEPEPKPTPIELPELKLTDEVNKNILSQVVSKLKKKYPEMPDDINSLEYKEWERDLIDEKGLEAANEFLQDKKKAKSEIESDAKVFIYAQENLKNLYDESVDEILPMLTRENLPKLKKLNDDFRSVNNDLLQKEVELIKKNLKDNYGITDKELGINLELTKDDNGSLTNEGLNSLMIRNGQVDRRIVRYIGKIPILNHGELAEKFLSSITPKIITYLNSNHAREANAETERLHKENLNLAGGGQGANSIVKTFTIDDVRKETDPLKLKKIQEDALALLPD